MSNLIDIQSQIEKLQKQANDIKAREFDKTVAQIKAQMLAFGITVKDLTATKTTGKGKVKAAKTYYIFHIVWSIVYHTVTYSSLDDPIHLTNALTVVSHLPLLIS